MIRLHGSGIAKVDTDKAQAQLTLFSDSDHPTICNIAKYRKQGKIRWARLCVFCGLKEHHESFPVNIYLYYISFV